MLKSNAIFVTVPVVDNETGNSLSRRCGRAKKLKPVSQSRIEKICGIWNSRLFVTGLKRSDILELHHWAYLVAARRSKFLHFRSFRRLYSLVVVSALCAACWEVNCEVLRIPIIICFKINWKTSSIRLNLEWLLGIAFRPLRHYDESPKGISMDKSHVFLCIMRGYWTPDDGCVQSWEERKICGTWQLLVYGETRPLCRPLSSLGS